jgi:hypothetical protein
MNKRKYELPLIMEWNPKSDITAYELAQCIPILISTKAIYGSYLDQNAFENLETSYLRNFNIKNNKKIFNSISTYF